MGFFLKGMAESIPHLISVCLIFFLVFGFFQIKAKKNQKRIERLKQPDGEFKNMFEKNGKP